MRSKAVNEKIKYTKEYAAAAAYVLYLCEASGIEGSNCAIIADSWFGVIRFVLGISKLVFQDIMMIKTESVG